MKSQITFTNKNKGFALSLSKGFTLIEMLIVVSIICIVGGIGLFFGFDTLRGYSFHSDRDTLVSALQHARAEAMANICRGSDCSTGGKAHGVFIDIPNRRYVIFQGDVYDENDENNASIDTNRITTFEGITEVVFAQLSGNASTTVPSSDCPTSIPASTSLCIILGDGTVRTSEIDINSEGQILWSN